ncbi:hypothetical protein [Microbacterium paraoxydans]|uniref:hypothetical protein n=1 Tax=Microbacterium paraoxydans TaxID=199592 RepID=UPI0004699616|nr:hypothetical protein [Microbacterium paraoxydans]
MAIIALASLAGAPGVTTAAIALAVHWRRPVVLIEADTSAASTMMAGFFRANLRTTEGGIEKLAYALTREALEAEDILNPELALAIAVHNLPPIPSMPIPSIPAQHQMWVVPGFVNLAVVDGVRSLWAKLPRLLAALGEGGIDVIIDLGRLQIDDPRLSLLDAADKVLICASASSVDLNRAYRRLALPDLAQRVRTMAGERYWSLLSAPVASELPSSAFTEHILPVVATLPHDPEGAAVFSHGRPDSKPTRNRYRGAARRAAQDLRVMIEPTEKVS